MTHEQIIRNSRNCCSTRTCGSSRHVSRPSLTRLPTRRTMMRPKLLYPLERKVSDGTACSRLDVQWALLRRSGEGSAGRRERLGHSAAQEELDYRAGWRLKSRVLGNLTRF